MSDDPDLTGRVSLNLTGLVSGLRFAQAVTRRQIGILVRDANQRLRGLDTDPLRRGLARIGGMIGSLGSLAAPFASAGAAVGGLVPLVAGLVSMLAQIAPAAALAVSGVLAIGLASTTLKIAMSGVGDAVKAALDPSDPEAYAAALKKLAPNARSFVQEIHKASPALDKIKKSVQDRVFAGLDKQLASTAKTTLPTFDRALDSTAGTLNRMGKGVFTAVRNLGKDGTLGTALKGATSSLTAFSRAPGQVVTALGQIGAAAAPAFARLSKAGGSALDRLAAKLTKSFESGGMEQAIEQAIDLIGQLGHVIGNVGSIVGSVFGAAQTSGGGFLGVLESVTAEIARIAKTDGVQNGLKSLFGVMQLLGKTVAPLLGQALAALGPVLTALAPAAETLISALGAGLSPLIKALGPVLTEAATAVGALVIAAAPLLTTVGELAASLLPSLTPLLTACTRIFEALAPVVATVADTLQRTLNPVLAALPAIIEPLATMLADQLVYWLDFLGNLLVELSPSLVQLGVSLGDLLIALSPLIVAFANLSTRLLTELAPYLPGIISLVGGLSTALGAQLSGAINNLLIPALHVVAALLKGDFSGAYDIARRAAVTMIVSTVSSFRQMPGQVGAAVAPLAGKLRERVTTASLSMIAAVQSGIASAVQRVAELPGKASRVLGNLGGTLSRAGAVLIAGFIAGIQSKIPSVQGVLSTLTSKIPDWKGPRKRDAVLLNPAGRLIIRGLIDGIDASTPALTTKLKSITTSIARAITINAGNRKKTSGLTGLLNTIQKDNKKLLALAKQRDTAATNLKAAQTKLADAIKQRSDAAAQIKGGIIGDANITGNNVVNSVSAITIGLQQAALKAKQFAVNLSKLKQAGLRTDLLDDIAAAGMDGGAATAAALAKATPAELKKINSLQASLVSSAGASGSTVAGAMYDAGVKAANGLVEGLKKAQPSIERAMEKIATAMVKAIRKKLDIHSPSRVARTIGEQFMAGMPVGFEAMRSKVTGAAASVAGAAARAASTVATVTSSIPAPGQLTAAYAGAAGAGPTTNNFYLQGGDATPDGILRALSWQGLIGRKGR
ncbi:hypothetical protein [Streptomyces sp. NPDC088726]|uniref:hypothetical protein n=1 Tax=Streptomyces sp. NPDC088726 TaxID=3365874 RepID=UPI003824536C